LFDVFLLIPVSATTTASLFLSFFDATKNVRSRFFLLMLLLPVLLTYASADVVVALLSSIVSAAKILLFPFQV
jgi:hypothetical protein